ncbi:enoyl-CoA hydratase/isomerase family protein [Catenulispora pinisilvae]|uniref:enoyl-CoA hydratase/isomerase family protein n=1 Tax=Catenulispora pinisilvae TaxID=2705253 RepID=UPI0018925A41|nr:enoyl-CoA hydratase/isomerase family protein [Catenulispora pinisilvae]
MYTTIKVRKDEGIAHLVIDNPPLNLLDAALLRDLDAFLTEVAQDAAVRVIVFESADTEFFVAHGDMDFIEDPQAVIGIEIAGDQSLNPMLRLHERLRQLPQVTIGKLAGLARGGGSELLLAMDLRFAAAETAGLAQNETSIGIIPGGGGSVYLPQLVGRARALEIILGGRLFDAATAERYGWINRALPAAELDEFVQRLAQRIATLAPGVARAAIETVDMALTSHQDGLKAEEQALFGLFAQPAALALTRAARAAGAQTRAGERDLESTTAGITAA